MPSSSSLRAVSCLLALFIGGALLPGAAQQAPAKRRAPPRKERADVLRFRARAEAILSGSAAQLSPRVAKGHWGALILDAKTGETLFDFNSQRYFTPASNTKLYTTAVALAALGPDYKFRTTVESHGTLDSRGRLRGDLVLVGRGDPNLSNRKLPQGREVERDGPPEKILQQLADATVAAGLRHVEGDVVADDSWFSARRYPAGWEIDDMPFNHGAAVSALAVNDNTLVVEVHPGAAVGEPAWLIVDPWSGYYSFENQIETVASAPEAGPAARIRIRREPGSRRIVLRGSIALGSDRETLSVGIEEPAEHASVLFRRLLEARGVRIFGQARARHAADPAAQQAAGDAIEQAIAVGEPPHVFADHESLPLLESIRVINKVSQNLHTELLLRAVGRERLRDGSTEAGLRFAQELFATMGIAERDVVLYDGSGLSRHNLITPQATVKLLQWVAQQPWAASYRETLPVSGQDGTLTRRMSGTSAAGRVSAKTGTLESVNALSGYATSLHGSELIFSMFGNSHNLRGGDATAVLDALCVAMVEEFGAPPPPRKRR